MTDYEKEYRDFYGLDKPLVYKCSCGGFAFPIDSIYIPHLCPKCGAPIEDET